MKNPTVDPCAWRTLTLLVAASVMASHLSAQTTPATTPATPAEPEEVLVLSPFEVTAEEDTGYVATSTL
ncbi:MAG: TonB-dependent receptor, partial [Verrucomicrobiota bacterium]|nr:TonB-dependent receptor [Verrucomicrobiota bacterium]